MAAGERRSTSGQGEVAGPTRRQVIGGLGAGAALAWVTPSIISADAASAATVAPASSTFLIASPSGEVYRSTDDALTWARVPIAALSWRSMTRIGTTWVIGSDNTDVAISTDDGVSFGYTTSPPGISLDALGTDGTVMVGGTLFGAGADPIWRSTDGGNTWAAATTVPGYGIPILAVAGTPISFVAVGGDDPATNLPVAWYSLDQGQNWLPAILPPSAISVGAMTSVAYLDGVLIAGGQFGLLWRSLDGGITWLDPTTPPVLDPSIIAIVGLASDGTTMWAAGVLGELWSSSDQGDTWNVRTAIPASVEDMTSRGSTFITVCDEIMRSTNPGVTWAMSNTGVVGTPTFITTV